jgi:hypothetical protein
MACPGGVYGVVRGAVVMKNCGEPSVPGISSLTRGTVSSSSRAILAAIASSHVISDTDWSRPRISDDAFK